jgi:hypothetical protein
VFRKFSNSLGPDALVLVEEILNHHEIEDDDVESSLETLAKEYNKQDGAFHVLFFGHSILTIGLLRCFHESLSKRTEESLRITSKSR